jgi:site-specific DNA-cytosine methylase
MRYLSLFSGIEAATVAWRPLGWQAVAFAEIDPFACAVLQHHYMAVRRLTPEECEKLQGFLPGYTAIPYRGKPAADGPRYRAIGNSMAVPVMRWIGERIQMAYAEEGARRGNHDRDSVTHTSGIQDRDL